MLATRNHEPPAKKQQASPGPKAAGSEPQQLNPIWQQLATRVQTKLQVSAPDDPYEREADRVADTVMRTSESKVQRSCAACAASGAPCQRCEEEEPQPAPAILRKVDEATPDAGAWVPDDFMSNLGPGQPLDRAARTFMEARFGRGFGDVHIHTGPEATESAQAIGALAYTVGSHVVVNSQVYAPNTSSGRRLLAHELVHTVQQGGSSTTSPLKMEQLAGTSQEGSELGSTRAVNRDPGTIRMQAPVQVSRDTPKGPPAAPKDVVLLGIDTPIDKAWADVTAPGATVVKAKNVNEMVAGLKKINFPIGTLFVILHGLPEGDLGFESGDTTTYVLPSKMASALKGAIAPANAPQFVDFRGCSLGTSPDSMDQIRAAMGASAARGSNCVVVVQASGPIHIGTSNITTAAQAASQQQAFNTGLQKLIDSFGAAKDCILDTSPESYFRAGGKMVAEWVNPEDETTFDKRKSKCFKSLQTEKAEPRKSKASFDPTIESNCKLVKVEKP